MTPIQLVYTLANRLRDITKDLRMEESDDAYALRAPHVWAQHLPEKLYEDEPDHADYPFILVMLGGGTGIEGSRASCNVAIVVCGYDDGQPLCTNPYSDTWGAQDDVRDRQGWTLPAMMAWRIITALSEDPTLGPFELDLERLSWELPGQEQPSPQWFGIIHMTWRIPLPTRDHRLDDMQSRQPPACQWREDLSTFMEGG